MHVLDHFRTLGKIRSTAENLLTAIAGEHYEVVTMYPHFLEDAKAEKPTRAVRPSVWSRDVEKIHEGLHGDAIEHLANGETDIDAVYWVCRTCGPTHVGNEHPAKCLVWTKVPGYKKID